MNGTPSGVKESPISKYYTQQVQTGKAPLDMVAGPAIYSEDSSWDELSEAKEKSMQISNVEVENQVMEVMKKCGALAP